MTSTISQMFIKNNNAKNISKITDKKKELNTNVLSKEVESIFINILIKVMKQSLPKSNIIDSNSITLYTEIYDQKISKILSNKGIGLSKILKQQIDFENK